MMIPKCKLFSLVLFALPFLAYSQENSPYSRYGIGNLVPSGNILNRGMGGISAGYADANTINFLNPASYSKLVYTTLDIGAQVDSRTVKSTNPLGKFTSNNAVISYLQIGFPLLGGNKKAAQKNVGWGLNIGLRPISKINYKIQNLSRIPNIDSTATIYEGSGGLNEAFIGTGIQIKNLSFGINTGYLFGSKNYSTRLVLLNDTVPYYASNSATNTSIGGLFFNAGIQYVIEIKKGDPQKGVLRVGAYGNLQKKYNASQDVLRETFTYNNISGSTIKIDSVYEKDEDKGKLELPATYGAGLIYEKPNFLAGLDFETTAWDNYRFYGQKDFVKNNWVVKAGFQYYPAKPNSKRYAQFIKYRAGIYLGPDYIITDKKLPQFGVTAGVGLPLKLKRAFYETQYSVMNLAVEYGTRGNNNNNIRENMIHISVGFSLSDIWFRRYKYQ